MQKEHRLRIFTWSRDWDKPTFKSIKLFMLVRIWGRIPLVTENEINYNTPKAEVNKIYELIESDALTAERMLPDKS